MTSSSDFYTVLVKNIEPSQVTAKEKNIVFVQFLNKNMKKNR